VGTHCHLVASSRSFSPSFSRTQRCVYRRLPLSQHSPIHYFTLHFSKLYFNIEFVPRYLKWSFLTKTLYEFLIYLLHATCSAHRIPFDFVVLVMLDVRYSYEALHCLISLAITCKKYTLYFRVTSSCNKLRLNCVKHVAYFDRWSRNMDMC
jgi:hypothetical protein